VLHWLGMELLYMNPGFHFQVFNMLMSRPKFFFAPKNPLFYRVLFFKDSFWNTARSFAIF